MKMFGRIIGRKPASDVIKDHRKKEKEATDDPKVHDEASGQKSAPGKVEGQDVSSTKKTEEKDISDDQENEGDAESTKRNASAAEDKDGSNESEKSTSVDDDLFGAYGDAAYQLQDILVEEVKHPELLQRHLDNHLPDFLKEYLNADFSDLNIVKEILGGFSMSGKEAGTTVTPADLDDSYLQVFSNYLKERVKINEVVKNKDAIMEKKLIAVQERMKKRDDSEDSVGAALEAIKVFENGLLDEEIRLQENLRGDGGSVEKVKRGWKWLGDMNAATLLSKKGYHPKNTFLGKVGHGALRMLSLRATLMASLVPIGFAAAGATGIYAAFFLRRGFGSLAGANAGHQFMKGWVEKGLKKRAEDLLPSPDEDGVAMNVIQLKKEYDTFIRTYYDTEDVAGARDSDEYKGLQKKYCEQIKEMCKKDKVAEIARLKGNEAKAASRTILRKNKRNMWISAGVGAGFAGFVTPKIAEWADWGLSHTPGVGRAWGGLKDLAYGVFGVSPESEPQEIPKQKDIPPNKGQGAVPPPVTSPDTTAPPETQIPTTEGNDGFQVIEEGGDETVTSEAKDVGQDGNSSSESGVHEDGAGEFSVDEEGVYTVQEGNWLSNIWLHKNGGDAEQMQEVMEALRTLQETDEGVQTLKDFGITSGDIDMIHPGDEIDVDAIQKWFDDTPSENHAVANDDDAATEEQGDESAAALPASVETVPGGDTTAVYHTVGKERTIGDVLKSLNIDTKDVDKEILEKEVFEGHEVQILKNDDGSFEGIVADGDTLSVKAPEEAVLPASVETVPEADLTAGVQYMVREERTIGDVLKSLNIDTKDVDKEILEKEVFEGHTVQILKNDDGSFEVVADGDTLSVEASGGPVTLDVGETLPSTDSIENLVKTAEKLGATVSQDNIIIARTGGERIMSAVDLRQLRPDLFADNQEISAVIERKGDEMIIQTDYPLQKKFLIETNKKGNLDHDYVQKAFKDVENVVKKEEDIHPARQEVIENAFKALTTEKPAANAESFDALVNQLSDTVASDTDLTDAMFSEKGWGDKRIRIAYDEEQGQLEVQKYINENRGKRNHPVKWVWKSVLTEKIAD